jgi:soluble lytic murein transglycosylase-like protein
MLRAWTIALVLAAAPLAGAGELRQWVDAEGVTHLTSGPSRKARARAAKLDVTPRASGQKTKVRETTEYDKQIVISADKYKLPHELIRAVIVAESNFEPAAKSPVGAQGLMQLMPATAAELFVQDPWDPMQNIEGGTRYLRILANQFGGDIVKTVAAYNAGPEAVKKHGGVPPYDETQGYVRKVIRLYRIYKGLGA